MRSLIVCLQLTNTTLYRGCEPQSASWANKFCKPTGGKKISLYKLTSINLLITNNTCIKKGNQESNSIIVTQKKEKKCLGVVNYGSKRLKRLKAITHGRVKWKSSIYLCLWTEDNTVKKPILLNATHRFTAVPHQIPADHMWLKTPAMCPLWRRK